MQMVRTRDESKLVLGYKRHRLNIIRYGVTANITAFHAVARGSIPRIGTTSFCLPRDPHGRLIRAFSTEPNFADLSSARHLECSPRALDGGFSDKTNKSRKNGGTHGTVKYGGLSTEYVRRNGKIRDEKI